jgi:hypothetical protein
MKVPDGFTVSTLRCCVATALLAVSATHVRAQSPACAAIAASDVAPIVGAAPMKTTAAGCSWNGGKDHYIMILDNTPRMAGMPVDAMFNAARGAASQNGTVTDESGLGDKAFLAVSSSGVAALQMLKKGRLLQVQMWDGSAPSAANLKLLRAIAAKAIAAS